jgi:hypothetical protein
LNLFTRYFAATRRSTIGNSPDLRNVFPEVHVSLPLGDPLSIIHQN